MLVHIVQKNSSKKKLLSYPLGQYIYTLYHGTGVENQTCDIHDENWKPEDENEGEDVGEDVDVDDDINENEDDDSLNDDEDYTDDPVEAPADMEEEPDM